jgi:hypothetical protein
MRLMTTIEARRDGTVRVRSSAGEAFVFQADGAGALVCEIADSALIQTLLQTGNFCVLDAGAEPERKLRAKPSKALQEVAQVKLIDGDLV